MDHLRSKVVQALIVALLSSLFGNAQLGYRWSAEIHFGDTLLTVIHDYSENNSENNCNHDDV